MNWRETFWNGGNPRQELYDRLKAELIPSMGHSKSLQGECLRAFMKIEHDAYNNGGGNNHSGSLRFLRANFPGFKQEWWDHLREYIVCGAATPSIKSTISEIGEAVVTYVEGSMSDLSPNVENLAVEQLNVEYLGPDGPEERPIDCHFPDDDEEEMTWSRRR